MKKTALLNTDGAVLIFILFRVLFSIICSDFAWKILIDFFGEEKNTLIPLVNSGRIEPRKGGFEYGRPIYENKKSGHSLHDFSGHDILVSGMRNHDQ